MAGFSNASFQPQVEKANLHILQVAFRKEGNAEDNPSLEFERAGASTLLSLQLLVILRHVGIILPHSIG